VRDVLTNAFVMAVDMGPMEAFRYIGAISASVAKGGLFKANKVARLYANNDIAKLKELAKKDDYVKDMLEFIEQGGIVSIVEGLSVQGQLSRLYKDLNRNKMLKTKEQIDKVFEKAKKGIIINEKINHTEVVNEIIGNKNKLITKIINKINDKNKNKNKLKGTLVTNSSNKIKSNLMTNFIGIK
jgi:hypothetical protein